MGRSYIIITSEMLKVKSFHAKFDGFPRVSLCLFNHEFSFCTRILSLHSSCSFSVRFFIYLMLYHG